MSTIPWNDTLGGELCDAHDVLEGIVRLRAAARAATHVSVAAVAALHLCVRMLAMRGFRDPYGELRRMLTALPELTGLPPSAQAFAAALAPGAITFDPGEVEALARAFDRELRSAPEFAPARVELALLSLFFFVVSCVSGQGGYLFVLCEWIARERARFDGLGPSPMELASAIRRAS